MPPNFTPTLNEAQIPTYQKTVSIDNQTAPIQPRIRSWLDSNCAHCHRPDGDGPGWDGRFQTPLSAQNLINNFVKYRVVRSPDLDFASPTIVAQDLPGVAPLTNHTDTTLPANTTRMFYRVEIQ